VRHTGIEAARVRLVYLGVRAPATPPGGPRAPIVLFVGSLFQRRRLDVVIDAFARVAATPARGSTSSAPTTTPRVDFAAAIAARGLEPRPAARLGGRRHARGPVREAAVFVFLSRYEGFGFTRSGHGAQRRADRARHGGGARICSAAAWRVPKDRPPATSPRRWPHCSTTSRSTRYRAEAAPVLRLSVGRHGARRVLRCLEAAVPGRSLAIVIVSYNVRVVSRCLRSLAAAGRPGPTTITIVDNRSSDGTLAWLPTAWPTCRPSTPAGISASRARTTSASAPTSEYA
jgi:hypothetical protein